MLKQLMVAAIASALIPKQARLCFFARMILLGLSIRFTATIHVPDSTWVIREIWYGPLSYKRP